MQPMTRKVFTDSRLRPARLAGRIDDDYVRFDDGSTRLRYARVRGKAAVKAAKRARHAARIRVRQPIAA